MNFKREQVQLLSKNKPFIVLQNVKDKYPNINSQSVILSQIKKLYLSDPNNRLSAYENHINTLIKNNPDTKDYVQFKNMNPYEQDKIQKKIRNGKIVYSEIVDRIIEKIPLFNKNIDKYIKLTPKDAKLLRRQQTQALNNKHYNIKIIDGDTLTHYFLPLLKSENPKEQVSATLLSCGRRQNELVNGNLSKSNSGLYFAIFDGQSKTGLDIKRKPYEIPLLAPYPVVKKAWDNSKKYFSDCKDRKKFKTKVRNISRWLKKDTNTNVDRLHEFRSIYALTCYQLFPTGRLSQMAFISSILGETSINIASHYNSIRVDNVNKIWVPEECKYDWKGGDKHTDIIVEKMNDYIMKSKMSNKSVKITKTLIGHVSEKSSSVVNRFYKKNEDIIKCHNNKI